MRTIPTAVLVSGNGSNLQALIDAEKRGVLAPARLAVVVSNVAGVKALERAREARIETQIVSHRDFPDRRAFEAALLKSLEEHQVEQVVLAGFMRILSPHFIRAFPDKILNTHPALCPSFPGTHAARQALQAGVKVTGCTVHLVDEGVDTGPIVFQRAVNVDESDTETSLQARIQMAEHELLPQATQLLAAGRLRAEGRTVKVLPWPP